MNKVFTRIGAVASRSVHQLRHDKRQIAISLLAPLLIIYLLKVLVDALASPFFEPSIYIVPYAAFIVHFVTFIMTTVVLVRERTEGTLARMFVSGYTPIDMVVGYLLAYTLLVTAQSLSILVELNLLFELNYDFELLASLYLVMWMLSVISLILGILISNTARNVGQVIPYIPLVVASMIVSGVIIPVDKLPDWTKVISYLTPMYYANELIQFLIGGANLLDDWVKFLGLPVYGAVFLVLATLTLRETD